MSAGSVIANLRDVIRSLRYFAWHTSDCPQAVDPTIRCLCGYADAKHQAQLACNVDAGRTGGGIDRLAPRPAGEQWQAALAEKQIVAYEKRVERRKTELIIPASTSVIEVPVMIVNRPYIDDEEISPKDRALLSVIRYASANNVRAHDYEQKPRRKLPDSR